MHVVPALLRAQHQLDELAHRAAAAAAAAHPVHALADFGGGIGRRRRQPDTRQHRQIEQVVAHVGDRRVVDAGVAQDLLVGRAACS